MEWTNDRVIDLIKLYEKHAVLWDSTDKFYKINNKKNDARKEISQELNLDVQEIKRKIAALLATYRKARQKVAQNTRMGTDELYSPWFAFKHFHFLHTKYQPKPTRNTEDTSTQNLEEEEVESEEGHTQEAPNYNTFEETAPQENSLGVTRQITGRKRMRSNEDPRINESFEILKNINNKQRDEYDAYGEYIARKLRSLDKRTAVYVQKGFNDILFKAELGEYPIERRDLGNYSTQTLQAYWSTASPSTTESASTVQSPYPSPHAINTDLQIQPSQPTPTPTTSQPQQTGDNNYTLTPNL